MILCLTLLTLQTPAARAAPVARVDWPVFLARHDLVWDRLPTRWGESAFIGNGRLGATIDAPGGVLGWTINRTDFVHDQSRFPIGRVVVKLRQRTSPRSVVTVPLADRKSTRLNSSHSQISYAVFCLKKKNT